MSTSVDSTESELLARLDARIAALEAELEEKRTARRVLAEMMEWTGYQAGRRAHTVIVEQRVVPYLPRKGEGEPRAVAPGGRTPVPGLAVPGLGIVDAAVLVLGAYKRPMGSDEIARAVLAGGYRYDKSLQVLRRTVRGVLGRAVRDDPQTPLTRAGRGLFALKEWGLPEQPEAPLFDADAMLDAAEADGQESEAAERE